jgi:hypothetical protein
MSVSWTVSPKWKKSLIERQHWTNGEQSFYVDTVWRGGSFTVYTDDDNPPQIEEGVDIYNCGYESELIECFDGCAEEYNFDDCDYETREWIEEFVEENSVFDLEEHGWNTCDCEMFIECELEITKDE